MRFSYQTTPNPDSIKIVRDRGVFIDSGLLSFSNAQEALAHPLAEAMFEIDGVANVLILSDFMTVTKESNRTWDGLWSEIEKRLEYFFSSNG